MLTQADKDRLAEFCGLKIRRFYWQPDTNPAHLMIVLEMLAKRYNWFYVLKALTNEAILDQDNFDFNESVCRMALGEKK